MTCPHCHSERTHATLVRKDKKSRVMLTFVITFLAVGLLSTLIFSLADVWALGAFLGFFVLALPVSIIATIIAIIIPARDVTVFICDECGRTTRA